MVKNYEVIQVFLINLVSVLFLFIPGIFLYTKKRNFYQNLILIFTVNFLFLFIVGIINITFHLKPIFIYVICLYSTILIFHFINKEIFEIYSSISRKLILFYKKIKNHRDCIFLKKIKIRLSTNLFKNFSISNIVFYVVGYFIFMAFYHSVLFPVTSADALVTHMPLIYLLFTNNAFPDIEKLPFINRHFFYDVAPFHVVGSLLYRFTNSDFLVRFLNPSLFLVSTVALYFTLKILKVNKTVRLFSLLIFSSSPAILSAASTLNNDIPVVAFFVLAIYYISLYEKKRQNLQYLFLADISIGLMIASKPTTFINYFFYLLFRLYLTVKNDEEEKNAYVFISYFLSLAIGSLRYVISFINFKNPFYPFVVSIIIKITQSRFGNTNLFIFLIVFAIFFYSFICTYAYYDKKLLQFKLNKKKIIFANRILSVLIFFGISFFLFLIMSNPLNRNNIKSIITIDKISNQNQPLGILVVTFTLMFLIMSIHSKKIYEKLLSLYVIIVFFSLLSTFSSSSIARYLIVILPVGSFMGASCCFYLLKEIDLIYNYFPNLKKSKIRIDKTLKLFLILIFVFNLTFSSIITLFGFKTISDPVYYPILNPFNSDETDLSHWKQFEIKMVNYINTEISKKEFIIVFPYNIYYIINYERLIDPQTSWFYNVIDSNTKENWLSVLKKEYNVSYIAIINSVALSFSLISHKVKIFFDYVLSSNQLLLIKKYEDTRTVSSKTNLFSALYYIK